MQAPSDERLSGIGPPRGRAEDRSPKDARPMEPASRRLRHLVEETGDDRVKVRASSSVRLLARRTDHRWMLSVGIWTRVVSGISTK